MKRVVLACLCAALAAIGASCAGPETVKVAFIGSISGKLTSNSTLGMNAIDLYLHGPEAAKSRARYELVVFDDKSDAANLDAIAAQIREQEIRFVIGPLPSAFAIRMHELLGGDRILEFGPVAAADTLEGKDDNFIKMYPSVRASAEQLAAYAGPLGFKRMVPVLDLSNKVFCEIWEAAFRKVMPSSVEVLAPVTFSNPSDVNYPRVTEGVLAARPDSILLVTNTFDGSMLCQLLRKRLPSLAIVSSSWSFNTDFLSGTGKSSEGTLFSAAFDGHSSNPRYLAFQSAYKERFLKDVSEFPAAYCYESIMVLDRAVNAARSTDPDKVKAAIIKTGRFEGLQGDFTIDGFGDAKRGFNIIAVKDGRYEVVK